MLLITNSLETHKKIVYLIFPCCVASSFRPRSWKHCASCNSTFRKNTFKMFLIYRRCKEYIFDFVKTPPYRWQRNTANTSFIHLNVSMLTSIIVSNKFITWGPKVLCSEDHTIRLPSRHDQAQFPSRQKVL